jgi:outer membrane immunogenic protein
MRKILLASGFLFAAAGGAFAADAVVYEPAPVAPADSVFIWTGGYVGIQGGYGWADADFSVPDFGFNGNIDPDSGFVGGLVGFNYQSGSFVGGIEADVNYSGLNDDFSVLGEDVDAEINWFGSIRGRAGFAFDRTLVFGTAGVAFAGADVDTDNFSNDSTSFTGWTVGAGVEHAFIDNWTVRAEYRYYDFGNEDIDLDTPVDGDFTMNTVSVGVAYKF